MARKRVRNYILHYRPNRQPPRWLNGSKGCHVDDTNKPKKKKLTFDYLFDLFTKLVVLGGWIVALVMIAQWLYKKVT